MILKRDRKTSGATPGATRGRDAEPPPIQRLVEDVIEVPRGAIAFQGPQNVVHTEILERHVFFEFSSARDRTLIGIIYDGWRDTACVLPGSPHACRLWLQLVHS